MLFDLIVYCVDYFMVKDYSVSISIRNDKCLARTVFANIYPWCIEYIDHDHIFFVDVVVVVDSKIINLNLNLFK